MILGEHDRDQLLGALRRARALLTEDDVAGVGWWDDARELADEISDLLVRYGGAT